MKQWDLVEVKLSNFPNQKKQDHFTKKIGIWAFIIIGGITGGYTQKWNTYTRKKRFLSKVLLFYE